MNRHPCEDTLLLLVSGQARSGTTMLTKAVAEHPEVFSNGFESNVIRDVLLLVRENLTVESRLRQLSVSPPQFALEFRRALFHVLFPVDAVAGPPLPTAVSTFSSLKEECFDFLTVLFPNMLIANIVRNGVEVVSSRMAHKHIGKHSFEEHCVAWAHSVDVVKWGQDRPELFVVRHEDTLDRARTQKVFDDLFARAGLSATERCTDFVHRKIFNTTAVTGESDEQSGDLSARVDRWKFWTQSQRQTFEQICAPAMVFFGYSIPWA